MGKESGIAWTHHTFNPWWGCTKVSPACDNCYAEALDARFAGDNPHWGPDAPRKPASAKVWNDPIRWNREAAESGKRTLVFCASMADVFEAYRPAWDGHAQAGRDPLDPWRLKLWATIARTPALTWLLLTKRPQNIGRMLPDELKGAPNVWLGTTIESPAFLWRAEKLIEHGAAAPVRFVSMEPLVERVDYLLGYLEDEGQSGFREGRGKGINWVITGCESGAGARNTPTDWYRRLRDDCNRPETEYGERFARIPFFFKQAPVGAEGITIGQGSWIKGGKLIEQPYLDGVQHVEFPT